MRNYEKIWVCLAVVIYLITPKKNLLAQSAFPDTIFMDVNHLFELVIQNNPSLKTSALNVEAANKRVEVAKNNLYPEADISISGYYLSDVELYSKKFSHRYTQDMPHFGNNASLEVNQLIWKGGQVKESIKLTELQADIAGLQYTSEEQEARLTALGYYLDLYKLRNQSKVYRQNIELAEQRLENINKFYNQGMVTRNDVIRGELMVSNLKLAKLALDNNIVILNRQLNVTIGMSENTNILPVEEDFDVPVVIEREDDYLQIALELHPDILLTKKAVDVNRSALEIANKDIYPSVVVFAGNTFQRPLTTATPVVDMYYNMWNAGVALNFNLGNLWKNKREINLRKTEIHKAIARQEELEAYIGVGIKSAFIKHEEAVVQNKTLATNKELAEENYRIMEKKYNNQLAIIIDLIDAAHAKLDAELQLANSEVNIIYAFYKLLKEAGRI